MNNEPNTTPLEVGSQEPQVVPEAHPQVDAMPATPPVEEPSLVFGSQPVIESHQEQAVVTQPVQASSAGETPEVPGLSLYMVRMFSGLSVLGASSYLVWTLLNYFMSEPSEFIFFDLNSINLYVLIYGTLFGALYIITSMRLDRAQKSSFGDAMSRPHHVVSSIWQSLLVLWGVTSLVSLLYAPISAASSSLSGSTTGGGIATEALSALYGLGMVTLLLWHDKRLLKAQSNTIPVAVVASVLVALLGLMTFATLNPKQTKSQDSFDFGNSVDAGTYDYGADTLPEDSNIDSTSTNMSNQ